MPKTFSTSIQFLKKEMVCKICKRVCIPISNYNVCSWECYKKYMEKKGFKHEFYEEFYKNQGSIRGERKRKSQYERNKKDKIKRNHN